MMNEWKNESVFLENTSSLKNTSLDDHDNEEKNQSSSQLKIANGITKLAGEEFLRFGLDKYRGLFFSKAHTYTRTEFENFCRENQLQLEK